MPLPDELLEEVFFRLPPDEPEHLARASLVSKVWLALLSDPRFRDFHGAPPVLGFLCSWRPNSVHEVEDNIPHFFPTTKFPGRIPDDDWGYFRYAAWDCRHGRVLLGDMDYEPVALVVWDPMTGCRRELDPPDQLGTSYGAAVLCAVAGCDHRACHAGPFKVVFIAVDRMEDERLVRACVSLPGAGDWSKPCSGLHLEPIPLWDEMAPVFVEDAVYIKLMYKEDDLNNSLGFAHVHKVTLHLWSRQGDSDGIGSWTQRTVIDLNNHLPIQNPNKRFRLIGSVEGNDIIFVTMGLDIYEISLKTLRWKKLQKREKLCGLISYMSFYNP
ncbi:uncharacterized protein [Triticum aestivum]|uniref:uncharacterized protein n=1 Tax=Triticum aestivum TaxID=4565 RepID=UPI001D029DDF|nr:uncharacterized protein LOC123084074 [Triticum aestivum]